MIPQKKRAEAIHKLFKRQIEKLGHPSLENKQKAAGAMDALVGPQWRIEINMPDVIIEPEAMKAAPNYTPDVEQKTEEFYKRVREALAAEGDVPWDAEYKAGDAVEGAECKKRKLFHAVKELCQK